MLLKKVYPKLCAYFETIDWTLEETSVVEFPGFQIPANLAIESAK